MLQVGHIDHLNLKVSQLDKSIEFYKKLFDDFQIFEEGVSHGNRYVILGVTNKLYLCLYESLSNNKGNEQVLNHMGIHVVNFEELKKLVKNKEIEALYGGVIDYPQSQTIYVKDPDGNEIEFSSSFGGGLN